MSAKVLKEPGFSKNGKSHANSTLRLNMSTRHMVCAVSDREHPFNDARLKKFFAWPGAAAAAAADADGTQRRRSPGTLYSV
jgi:hypothetical protein